MSDEKEVLDAHPVPRSRRWVAVLLLLLLVLGVGAVVLDRSSRARASEQVDDCRQQAAAEIDLAFGRLTARTGTVRPTVFALPDGEQRQELLGLVSEAVAGVDARLRTARTRCEEVDLLWYHGDLARRRDDCVVALEELTAWFGEISRDGARAFGGGGESRSGCG